MTELKQVYKCAICGNIVEVVHAAGGQLVCCGKPMELKVENTVDAAKEKHVPVIEKTEDGVIVKIGEVEHPMLEEHHIEWIELHVGNKLYRKFLKAGDKPEAKFKLCSSCMNEKMFAREYCNLHGLWKAEI